MSRDISGINSRCSEVVRVPFLRVPIISASRTLGIGGTQSFQPPGTLGTGEDSVLSAQPLGLEGLSHFQGGLGPPKWLVLSSH